MAGEAMTAMFEQDRCDRAGFTLNELLVVLTVVWILAAMTMPVLGQALARYRLGMAVREVERELQTARVKAVATNRTIQVLFDCPTAGRYRRVEVLSEPGVPDARDNFVSRCDATTFPFPPQDSDPLTRPNLDGPLHYLPPEVTASGVSGFEFLPNGTARSDANGGTIEWSDIGVSGVTVTLTKGTYTRSILVNGMGRVLLVQP
jgi:prepilin-type N-terminal cleavage/methylation domain-containing protein